MLHYNITIAACTFELSPGAGAEIQLFPAGEFRATDGRPHDIGHWKMSGEVAARIIAANSMLNRKKVIDYEHQTLLAEVNGQPAPAAGWMSAKCWQYREGRGFFATAVEWTERARQMIANGEYKYISPVFSYDKTTGEITNLLNAALTNDPGLDMPAVALRSARLLLPVETPPMKELAKLLGLKDDADEAACCAAVTALKTDLEKIRKDNDSLSLDIVALKSKQPDPAQYVSVSLYKEMEKEVTALKQQQTSDKADALIAAAATRLTANQKAHAEALKSKGDLDGLKSFLDCCPEIEALKGTQTGGKATAGGTADMTAQEIAQAACKLVDAAESAGRKLSMTDAVAQVKANKEKPNGQ